MPNPIKYSTNVETRSLRSGNFYIGTGDVDKGPTNVVVGPDNRTVYVVNELSNTIVVTDVP